MSETSLLDLPLLEAAQAQKHVTHNEALLKLDAIVQLAVITRQLAVPPGSPVESDRYLIASGATGAWTAHAGDIATSQSGAWVFAVPRAGWRLWVQDEEKLLVFTGTVWKDVNAISALQNLSLLGVNTSADTGNRLAVASPAVLFNHAGGDQRVKVNKQAAGNTASLLYQTDFSGRAEMGLAGDDNFHFKVSPNGASWTEAIVIDRTTGVVTMPATPSPGISDGDKGDITVSGSGTAWSLDTSVIDNRYIAIFANGLAVKAYGMVADFGAGNTDNTAAMQAAITAALSSGAKTILIPPGEYYFPSTTPLDPGAGDLTFRGAGKNATVIRFEEGASPTARYLFKNITNTAKGSLRFEGIHFKGTWTAANTDTFAANSLWLDYYSTIEIVNCKFSAIRGQAMDVHYCGRLLVSDCLFEDIGRDAIRARDTSGIIVTGNTITRCGDDPIALHTNTATLDTFRPIRSRIVVSNNILTNCNGSISVIGARHLSVTGNLLKLCHGTGIAVQTDYLGLEGNNPIHDIDISHNTILDMVQVRGAVPGTPLGAIAVAVPAPKGGTATNGVIPGSYDAVSSAIVKPWDWYNGRATNAADAIPRSPRIRVCDNTTGRTLPAATLFSDYGYGKAMWQNVLYDPAVSDATLTPFNGINLGANAGFIGLDISRNSIENVLAGMSLPAATSNLSYQDCTIRHNKFYDTRDRCISFEPSSFNLDVVIEGNVCDADPLRRNANSNLNGTYLADSTTPRAIDVGDARGVQILRNVFRNTCRAVQATAPTAVVVRDNAGFCATPVALGFNAANKGIGNVPSGDGWEFVIEDSDPTSATYKQFSSKMARFASAMPSSGWYYAGWHADDTTGATGGWTRLTTGTAHVLNTDWRAEAADATLLNRANHTGTQLSATLGDSTTAGRSMLTAADAAAQTALLNSFGSALKGLAPASGGGTTNFLRADGTWTAPLPSDGDKGDVVVSGGGTAWTVDAQSVTFAKMQNIATDRLLGRDTAASGSPEELTVGGGLEFTGAGGIQTSALTGDVTKAAGGTALTITAAAVSNAKLANVATATIKGRITAATGTPEDLTATQATSMLDAVVGDSGAGGTKGLVPAPAAGDAAAGKFLKANGTWTTPTGSGDVAGPASATDKAIARFNLATGKLIQNSAVLLNDDGSVRLPAVAAPAAPAASTINLFALDVGARMMPAFKAPSGLAAPVQPLLARNKVSLWNPAGNSAVVPGVFGMGQPTTLGTATARNPAATNLFTRMRRMGYVSAATAGSFAGHYDIRQCFTIGDGAGLGGFLAVFRFGVSDAAAVSGARMFVGLRNSVSAPTNVEPSTLTNQVGVAALSASSNLQIVYGGSAAQTAIDLGVNFPANTLSADAYDLTLFAPPNSQVINYRVERLNTGDAANGTLSGTVGTAIPAAATFLTHSLWRCNNATALAVGLDIISVYIESDY